MYLLIFEDGGLAQVNNLSDDILSSFEQGTIDIINISGGAASQYKGDGVWQFIHKYNIPE